MRLTPSAMPAYAASTNASLALGLVYLCWPLPWPAFLLSYAVGTCLLTLPADSLRKALPSRRPSLCELSASLGCAAGTVLAVLARIHDQPTSTLQAVTCSVALATLCTLSLAFALSTLSLRTAALDADLRAHPPLNPLHAPSVRLGPLHFRRDSPTLARLLPWSDPVAAYLQRYPHLAWAI